MNTIHQMTQQMVEAFTAGDVDTARRLAFEIKQRKASLGPVDKPMDPTAGMSNFDKFRAGFGKAFVDLGSGAAQAVGFGSPEDTDEARRLDEPLMRSGYAQAGNVGGNIAALAPFAMIPGMNTVAGSAALGGVSGLMQPVGSKDSRLSNVIEGTALGGAVPAALTAAKVGKSALIDPFREKGREAIAGRMIQRFARDPSSVDAAQNVRYVSGARPTLAEATQDPGIAQLQRTVMTQNPQAANMISSRLGENNAARVGALQDIAGDPGKRALYESMRETTAEKLYGQAFRAGVNPKQWEKVATRVEELMQRPLMKQAQAQAKRLAMNSGVDIGDPKGSVQGLHWMKKSLDDMLDRGAQTGIGNVERRAVAANRDELIAILDKVSPKYAKARAEYEALSRPINQMDVGQRLLKQASSAMSDFSGNPRMYGEAFARGLRDEDATVKAATGMRRSLDHVMTPDQMGTLRGVSDELSRAAGWQSAGKVPGSPTAQYLVGGDILRRTAGPVGLPKSWLESTFAENILARPASWAYKVPEERIMGLLGEAMTDPATAARLLREATKKGPVRTMLEANPKAHKALQAVAAGVQVAPLGLLDALPTE